MWGSPEYEDIWHELEGDEARVDPLPEYLWIWRAWHRLSSERQWIAEGFGMPLGGTVIKGRPSTIPWTVVQAWAVHHDLTHAEMTLLDRCLIKMDGIFISHWSEKLERSLKK